MEIKPEVLTENEVAKRLKVSTETLRKWRRDGVGPPAVEMPGRLVRYSWRRVVEWIEREAPPAQAPEPGAEEVPEDSEAAPEKPTRQASALGTKFTEDFCKALAGVHDGWKPPSESAYRNWCIEADRMLRERSESEARGLAQWLFTAQTEGAQFWRSNVLSVPKFRKQFDQLAAKKRHGENGHARAQNPVERALRNIVGTH
jgi:predicted DNA-binding transcriptional regulator AlpA